MPGPARNHDAELWTAAPAGARPAETLPADSLRAASRPGDASPNDSWPNESWPNESWPSDAGPVASSPVVPSPRASSPARPWRAGFAAAPRRLWPALRSAGRAAADVVLPPACLACAGATGGPHGLCCGCWSRMTWIERPYCERRGTPFPYEVEAGGLAPRPLLSPAAIADPPVYRRARAAAVYDGVARDLVHRLKYGDRTELARALGAWMARAGREVLTREESGAPVLVPVPLHPWRRWRRRFNQAELLAGVVARAEGLALVPALRRVRFTRPQAGLTRAERGRNLQGAFRCEGAQAALVRGRRCVLVDDVVTTGATANACARALLRAGADAVDVLSFAIVPG